MQQAERGPRYTGVAMLLHWTLAVLVIANWQIAEQAHEGGLAREAARQVMGYHMAVGMLILFLSLARLAWRLTHRPPAFPSDISNFERVAGKTVHVIFYVLLIGMPLAGWLASSLGGRGVNFFGLFTIPALPVGANDKLGHSIFEAHATAGTVFLLLIALHILAALKHTFWDKDGELWRMLPFGTPKA